MEKIHVFKVVFVPTTKPHETNTSSSSFVSLRPARKTQHDHKKKIVAATNDNINLRFTTMCRPKPKEPSMLARYTAASILVGFLSLFCYHAFPPASATPGLTAPMHSFATPLALTAFYLASLPALRFVAERFLAPRYDMKSLLTESMVVYNLSQVALNGWMVYAMVDAVVRGGHPFVGSRSTVGVSITSGASYAVWAHYCDKYLEFFDTYFMVLRGKMDQVSFFW